jgi:SAM-dependent methyltransferase
MLLRVEGLSNAINEGKLEELFSKIGRVESAIVIRDIYSGRSRGFGFVEMPNQAEAQEATRQLNGFVFGDREITVKTPHYQQLLQGEMEFKEWLIENASDVLRRVGVKEGMFLLDYGCGPGKFTIPGAKIVGREGRVYAADIRSSAIEKVKKEAEAEGLENIETLLCERSELHTVLEDESVDAALVYDVMHSVGDRAGLLGEIHRVLRPDGFFSIFPMHLGTEKMIEIIDPCHLFHLRDRYSPTGYKTASEILNFHKVSANS